MERVTLHTHSDFVAHAEDPLSAMVDAAAARGISTMAATEHYPLTKKVDPRAFVSLPAERLEEYLAAIKRERARHPEIELLCGCEMDWLENEEDRDLAPEDFEPFEVVLGSVHFVDGWAFDDPTQISHWDEVGVDAIWRRYFEIYCHAATSSWPITIMSHPDLVKKFGHRPTIDPTPLYRDAAEATRVGGRMIELNTSGAFYDCKEFFPGPELLREFHHAEVPATLGTDAHLAANIDRAIEAGYKALYEAGYRELTIPTRDGDRRTIPLER